LRPLAVFLLVCFLTPAFPALAEEDQPAEEQQPETPEAPWRPA